MLSALYRVFHIILLTLLGRSILGVKQIKVRRDQCSGTHRPRQADGIEAAFSPTRSPPHTPPPTIKSQSHGSSSLYPARANHARRSSLPDSRGRRETRGSGAPSTPEVVGATRDAASFLSSAGSIKRIQRQGTGRDWKMTLKGLEAVRRTFCATFSRNLC